MVVTAADITQKEDINPALKSSPKDISIVKAVCGQPFIFTGRRLNAPEEGMNAFGYEATKVECFFI